MELLVRCMQKRLRCHKILQKKLSTKKIAGRLYIFNRGKLCIFRNKRPIFEPDNNLFPRKIISKQHYTCTNVCRTRYTVCHNRCDILVGICASSEGAVEMLRYTITEIVSIFLSKSTALMLFIYSLYNVCVLLL